MYSSDCIIEALKRNPNITCQGVDMVKCPRHEVIDNNRTCTNEPDTCTVGHEKKCKQHVHIFRGKTLIRIIEFRFMRSPTDACGFIKCNDKCLQSLLRNGIITL
jgi:uncharacterized DUF497 family protein